MVRSGLAEKLTVLYLNICGGQWFEELVAYLQAQKHAVDVFCFQEVLFTPEQDVLWTDNKRDGTMQRCTIYAELCQALPEYQPFFAWFSMLPEEFPLYIGNAMFVRPGRVIKDVFAQGDIMVYRERNSLEGLDVATLPRNLQYATLGLRRGELHVFNFHGMWTPNGKVDTPQRRHQFQRVRDAMLRFPGPKILGGDFNTYPTSDASIILERGGLQNLVRQYRVNGTRSSLYERKDAKGSHADNVFVQDVKIAQFYVPEQVAVSDHLPLLVTCTL